MHDRQRYIVFPLLCLQRRSQRRGVTFWSFGAVLGPLRFLCSLLLIPSMPPLFAKADQCSHTVIGAAIEVHRWNGLALIESIHEKCLMRELSLRSLAAVNQRVVKDLVCLECRSPPRRGWIVSPTRRVRDRHSKLPHCPAFGIGKHRNTICRMTVPKNQRASDWRMNGCFHFTGAVSSGTLNLYDN